MEIRTAPDPTRFPPRHCRQYIRTLVAHVIPGGAHLRVFHWIANKNRGLSNPQTLDLTFLASYNQLEKGNGMSRKALQTMAPLYFNTKKLTFRYHAGMEAEDFDQNEELVVEKLMNLEGVDKSEERRERWLSKYVPRAVNNKVHKFMRRIHGPRPTEPELCWYLTRTTEKTMSV